MIRKQTYIDCFIQAASTYGSKTAVDDGERTITYAELDDCSSRLASVLIDNGIGVGDFVVLLTPRKVSHAVALLAVGKAGGCYVPVNPSFPTERINYILQETTPKVILTEDSMWQALPQLQSVHTGNAAVLALDNLDYGSAAPLPSARSEWEGRAALLYTSGTTGNPKGVLHAFRGLTLVVENNISCGLSSHDAVHAAVGDFMFMPSVLDVLTPLCCGATTHYLSSDYLTDMPRLYRFICEHGITTMFMPTGVGVAMLNSYQLPLQHLTVAGERLSGLTFRLNRDLHIINNYGSTEGANITMRQVLPDETDSPLGKPEPGITYYILDEHLQPVPAGESGEFCYCSDRLALGYYNKPEATQSKFVACPFAPERTMYRTGDLVRQNANGELVHMGRIDNMVKVNGVRIETGEVENVAVRLDGMIAAVCVARKVSNASLLCIYYEAERPIEEAELRSHLAASLAATMLPTIYVQMEHLPRNLRGKISRSDLPEVAISLDFTPPSSVLEEKITQTVEQVLECETHGVCTNLIALGMSSLQAMRIAATLQTEHGISIAVRTMMQYPTVRLMAENATTGEAASCDDTDNTAEFPMLGCQHGIYLDWVRQESSTRYNIPIIITYPLDLYTTDVVLSAVQKVLVAHPSLRIRISTQKAEGLPTLTIGKAMPATNTTHIEEEPTTEYIARFITPFSPSDKCYYRVNAIVSPLATTVIIDIHHFVIDGIGADMLIKEISMALMGEDIPKETYTIRSCSLFESKQITTDFINGAFAHYDSIMTDATDADFHIANHSGEGRGTASTTVSIRSELMQELCHRHAITHNAFFCLVMAECLYRLTREENLRFLTISNGRQSNPLAVNTVSMFANTVPVAYRASSNAGINEVIQQMHKQLNESYRYDAVPFVTLAKRYGITPRCMFVFQEKNVGHGVEKHVSRPWLSEDSAICPFVAQVWHNLRNSAFTLSIDYDRSIHSEADVQLFAQLFTDIAGNMMETLFLDADAKLQAVANMTADKVGHVMDISSGKALEYDHSETIVDMVLRHAHNNPDSLAVSAVDGTLTYAELDRQSLAVARALQCHGVSRGEFVGIMLPRISSFVSAVLGVMRLGAAYVPIDPDYPQERINYMKEDCGAKILIDFAWIDGVLRDNKDNGVTEQEAESLTKTEPSLPAYMIYTSGSTGKPKGTVITHRALRAFVAWNIDAFSITPESRNAHYCSFSFDASMNDLMCPLAAGASIYIMPAEIRQDINGMYRYLLDNAINGVSIPTALTDAMLTQYHDLPVDYVLVGGERMTAIHEGTKVSIVNCYGPTEFTVCATYYTIDSHSDANNIPIGRPVPNTSACVCDPRGNLLPLGLEGELLLSGHQISEGYWHQPGKTAESFVDDCGSRFAYGGKRYRTGDIVRYNADGNIEFCGRIDNQVKLRGYRIELGEIETAACALPQLKHAVCRIRQVGGSDKLCLWYSTTDGQHDTLQTILADHLGKTLPEYMVPDHLIYVEEFPKTPTGKVDDSQLTVTTNTVSDYIPPVTADERTLCHIAAEILHLDRVSLTADLIHQLGMSSLQVLQFAAQASANGMNVKVGDVYKAKTISALLHIDRHKPYFIIGSLDDDKPLIIIIQGIFLITGEENELIRHLRERYTILVFETLDDTFAEVDDISFEALMEMYISIIDEVLRGRHISFMFGYCFGGEIALHLSHIMSVAKGNGPAVIAFDPIYDRSNIPSLLQPAIASHQRIAPALAAQYPQYHYHDNFIILFSGEKTTRNLSDPLSPEAIEASHQMMTDSQQEWRNNLPDIPKYTLPGDHYCMFRPDILSIVSDIVKKHRL